jgi:hypothetical protein
MTNDYIVEHGWENQLHPRYTSHLICNRKMLSLQVQSDMFGLLSRTRFNC